MENKRLNIALVLDTYLPMMDGVVNAVDNYARLLSKNHNVTVFVPRTKNRNYKDDFPYRVVRCKILPLNIGDYNMPLPKLDKNLKNILKNETFDIIHFHSAFTLPHMVLKYALKKDIPCVVTLHSQYYRDFYLATKSKLISRLMLNYVARFYNKCNELWTMNPACEQLSRAYGYKGKVRLVSNGTNLENNFSKQQLEDFKTEIKQKHNIGSDEKVFLYIGRLHILKNIDFIIDVCKNLVDKNFKFKLLLVGAGVHRKHFEKKVSKLNLQNYIIFVGGVYDLTEKCKYIVASDIQIFPSYYDTDGIVRIETAAFGVPTMFIENSIAASVITDNHNGYIGKNNVNDYANKIIDIFSDEKTFLQVKENCKKEIYIKWEDVVKQVEQNYIEIINNKKEH